MREISAGVYHLLKSTRQHEMPVGEFVDRVSTSDKEVEGTKCGAQSSIGFCVAVKLRMVREYGSPSLLAVPSTIAST